MPRATMLASYFLSSPRFRTSTQLACATQWRFVRRSRACRSRTKAVEVDDCWRFVVHGMEKFGFSSLQKSFTTARPSSTAGAASLHVAAARALFWGGAPPSAIGQRAQRAWVAP